jgi:hypothetical protein
MTFDEMKKRYNAGEDSLDLTLEKWEKILNFSKTIFHLSHYQEILKAAVVPVFLCTEYANQCHICPIFTVCKQGQSNDWNNIMKILQAYAIAGDLLPKETFSGQLETFVKKLQMCREESLHKMH